MMEKKIIGITGGIGAGKSTASRIIKGMGYNVYDADKRAKALINSPDLRHAIVAIFGENVFKNDTYQAALVGEQVFKNPALLQQLNRIVHPAVRADFQHWLGEQTQNLVFKESAILFEHQLERECHAVIVITAHEQTRIQRVMQRDGKTQEQVLRIIKQQMSQEKKIALADFVISNDGTAEELIPPILAVLKKLAT